MSVSDRILAIVLRVGTFVNLATGATLLYAGAHKEAPGRCFLAAAVSFATMAWLAWWRDQVVREIRRPEIASDEGVRGFSRELVEERTVRIKRGR